MCCHPVRGRTASPFFALSAILALTAGSAFAQTFGEVTGRINDASGGAVARATVTLLNTSTNGARKTLTTDDGDYAFPSVPPGFCQFRTVATDAGSQAACS